MKKHLPLLLISHLLLFNALFAQVWTEVHHISPHGGQLGSLSMVNTETVWGVSAKTLAVTYNAGETWETKEVEDFGQPDFTNLDVSFVNEKKGFLIRHGMGKRLLLRTQDGGETWAKIKEWNTKIPNSIFPTDLAFFDENIGLLICTQGAILRTVDGGDFWENVNTPIRNQPISLLSIDLVGERDAWVTGREGVVLHSKDQGRNWIQKDIGANGRILWDLSFPTPMMGYILVESGSLFKTVDGGDTWTRMNGLFYQHCLHFLDEERGLIGDIGVSYTLDGGRSLVKMNTAPETYHVIDVVADSTGQAFALANGGGVYRLDGFLYTEKDFGGNETVKISRNPTLDFISVEGQLMGCDIRLLSPAGKLLFEKRLYSNQLKISLASFPAGIYFLEVRDEKSRVLKKVIKI